jgi:predicted 2-oxoglutarate/Fe(II)-dependent dioxygenase YbiX
MPSRIDLVGNDVFVILDFLTPSECESYIRLSETAGYGDAPITTMSGPKMRKDIRNNDRVMIDDTELAAAWFERAKPYLASNFLRWTPVGLNERFRYYRYTAGQKFDWHMDGPFERANDEASKLTFMIYLNDACTGGETLFNLKRYGAVNVNDPILHVSPSPGKALVFRHDILHTGAVVTSGVKYVIRSDVMFV